MVLQAAGRNQKLRRWRVPVEGLLVEALRCHLHQAGHWRWLSFQTSTCVPVRALAMAGWGEEEEVFERKGKELNTFSRRALTRRCRMAALLQSSHWCCSGDDARTQHIPASESNNTACSSGIDYPAHENAQIEQKNKLVYILI